MSKADFQAFYRANFERVYRFVLFRVKQNTEVTEDLTSEIFMKALQHFEKYDPSVSKTAWIMTIARNHLLNHYRGQKELIDLEEVQFVLEGEDGGRSEEVKDDLRELKQSLDQLPREDRQVIELKYLQGYRYKEIGELTGKSTGAARIEAYRAMRKLKSLMRSEV